MVAPRSLMSKAPIVFKSTHRIRFSELDPYDHVSTGNYATYYVDHRMQGLRDRIGWGLEDFGDAAVHGLGPEDGDRLRAAGSGRSGDHHHLVRA